MRRSISHSFRAVPDLLGFVNDLFAEVGGGAGPGRDSFRFEARDRFPVPQPAPDAAAGDALGVIAGPDRGVRGGGRRRDRGAARRRSGAPEGRRRRPRRQGPGRGHPVPHAREPPRVRGRARAPAHPDARLQGDGLLRRRRDQGRARARPVSRESVVRAARGRAAARAPRGGLRPGPAALAGVLSPALVGAELPAAAAALGDDDRRALAMARRGLREWTGLVDRLPPAEVLDRVLCDAAYAFELRGPRAVQAQANLGKMRALVRRIQNRGYATMARVAQQIDRLSAGMANAVVEAVDAVALMTVHAAKGLEFPSCSWSTSAAAPAPISRPCGSFRTAATGSPRWRSGRIGTRPPRRSASATSRRRSGCSTSRQRGPATACTCPWSSRTAPRRAARAASAACCRRPSGALRPGRGRAGRPARGVAGAERGAARPAGVRAGVRRAAASGRGAGGQRGVTARPARAAGLAPAGRAATRDRVGGGPGRGRAGPEAAGSRRIGRLFHLLLRRYEGAPVPPEALERAARELADALEPAEGTGDEGAEAARLYGRFVAGGGGAALRGRELLWRCRSR